MFLVKSLAKFNQPFFRSFSTIPNLQFLKYEQREKTGLIEINRPKALNALCDGLIVELTDLLLKLDQDPNISVFVLTGSEKSFAAGADIKEMKDRDFEAVYKMEMFQNWEKIRQVRKPIIAAVNGFALGGGCELAMLCDIIIAGNNAQFGQPEILLGTIPGCGGTQRLTKALGKSKAMEMILTGSFLSATDAEKHGLVSKVVDKSETVKEALEIAKKISSYSKPIVSIAKDCVNKAFDSSLTEGLNYEKRLFWMTFATMDRKEGMEAFVGKRKPNFEDK